MSQSSNAKNSVSPDRVGGSGAAGWGGPERHRWARAAGLAVTAVILAIVGFGVLSGSARATTPVAPTVTGNPQVGQTLTAPAGLLGPVAWYTCDSGGNVIGSAPLSPSTQDSYELQNSDLTTYVCATQDAETFVSAPVGPITIPIPTITGEFVEGQTIQTADAAAGEPYTVDYQWRDCDAAGTCNAIADATGRSYTLTANDVGQQVELEETPALDSATYPSAAATSTDGQIVLPSASTPPPTPTPTPPTPTPTPTPTPKDSSAPSITGTTQLGQTLTATPGTATPTATSYDYQWLRCALNCTAISGAVGATYELDDADVGDTIAVTVTAHSSAGATTATSPRTGTVTAPSTLQIVASPSRPLVNQPVTIVGVVTSSAAGTDPSGTVAFADDGSSISGCAAVSVPATGQTVTVSCTTGFPVSSPSLSASFSPALGTPLLGSSASTMAISVQRGYSTTSLDVPARARRGATTTYTASIAAARNLIGPVLPTGTVTFLDHGKAIAGCRTARIKDGGATCTVHTTRTGTQAISARYAGNANFRGSVSAVKSIRVTAPPSKRTAVLGSVTATMQWTFHYTPGYTQIVALVVHGAHPGSAVTIHCTGRGCPFKSRVYPVIKQKPCKSTRKHTCPAPGTVDLESHFRHRNLRVHAEVTITVTQKRYVGKFYRFAIRARRQPSVKISCLAVGSTRPGAGCAAP